MRSLPKEGLDTVAYMEPIESIPGRDGKGPFHLVLQSAARCGMSAGVRAEVCFVSASPNLRTRARRAACEERVVHSAMRGPQVARTHEVSVWDRCARTARRLHRATVTTSAAEGAPSAMLSSEARNFVRVSATSANKTRCAWGPKSVRRPAAYSTDSSSMSSFQSSFAAYLPAAVRCEVR